MRFFGKLGSNIIFNIGSINFIYFASELFQKLASHFIVTNNRTDRQDRQIGQGQIGQIDRTGTDRTGTERTGTDRTGTDRTGTDRTGTDRRGTDRTGTDRTRTDRTGTDRTGLDRTGTDRTDKIDWIDGQIGWNDRIPRFIACRRSIFLINTSNMVIPHTGLVIPLIRR